MSHYLVGVVVDSFEDIERKIAEILAPYDENLRVEPYISRTVEQMISDAKERKERYSHEENISDYMKPYLEAITDRDFYNLEHYEDEDYDIKGNELTTYNPKSKWDWYSIGGRWSDKDNPIKIKDFKLYTDIDDNTRKMYEEAWSCFENHIKLSQEILDSLFDGFNMWKDSYYLTRYGTCDNWIKQCSSNIPYAFVDTDGWYEKGKMGWFGCDNATQESIDDYTEFAEKYFTAEETQNKYIVWVDCHI